jgi:5-methylcytosine-specific restriction endonuclease McrA
MFGGSNKLNKGLKKKILELYEKGFSYREIEKKLGCSKGSVCYHCGKGQKQKTRNRQRKNRQNDVLGTKISRFLERQIKKRKRNKKDNRLVEKILGIKITQFSLTGKRKDKTVKCKHHFNTKNFLAKIGSNPVCYLTGRKIDLEDGKSYHLDHIIPRSKGGENSLDNCGLTCRVANQSKSDLTLEEFVQLCQEVIDKNKPIR